MVAPVAPGDVLVVSPSEGEVVMSAAMQVEVRVAEDWTATLEVNGQHVGEKNIGLSRVDHKNKVATFTFVGLNVRPGQNRVRAFAVSPEGKAGRAVELNVHGTRPRRAVWRSAPSATNCKRAGAIRPTAPARLRPVEQPRGRRAGRRHHFGRPLPAPRRAAERRRQRTRERPRDKSAGTGEEIAGANRTRR
jgi:hypothetical protein